MRVFPYKILSNILYLNKALFKFGKVHSPLCSYCKIEEETVLHLLQNCVKIKELWNNLREYFSCGIKFPILSPQSAVFGFSEDDLIENRLIINNLLLIFKFYIYKERENGNFPVLMKKISQVKSIEEDICNCDEQKIIKFNKKWSKIKDMLY